MNVLVLGGAGYVGSALVPFLEARGYGTQTVDLGWYGAPAGARFRTADYRDLGAADLAGADAVVVLAGHSSVAMCAGQAAAAHRNNAANLARLLRHTGDRQVVYASTAGVYGRTAGEATEGAPTEIRSPYDASKGAAERAAQDSGRPVVCFRFGTVCGGAPHLRVDLLLNKMAHDAKTLGHVAVAPGAVWRPVLGLGDLCRAVAAVLSAPPAAGVYNLASFNATVGGLGRLVAERYAVPRRVAPPSGSPYDMRTDCAAFARAYDFAFRERPDDLLDGIDRWHAAALKTVRTGARAYG